MLEGIIDLSHHNPVYSWQEIKDSGVRGIIHKATQGVSFIDQDYVARKRAAGALGIKWGAYHFGECGQAREQAWHFLDTTQPEPSDLLVLDFEPCGATMRLDEAETFVREVWNATSRPPVIYANQSFLTDCMRGVTWSNLQPCCLWIARYGTAEPQVPPLWPIWTMWQWTDKGTIPGIQGPVDLDRFNGSEEQLSIFWGVLPAEEETCA